MWKKLSCDVSLLSGLTIYRNWNNCLINVQHPQFRCVASIITIIRFPDYYNLHLNRGAEKINYSFKSTEQHIFWNSFLHLCRCIRNTTLFNMSIVYCIKRIPAFLIFSNHFTISSNHVFFMKQPVFKRRITALHSIMCSLPNGLKWIHRIDRPSWEITLFLLVVS